MHNNPESVESYPTRQQGGWQACEFNSSEVACKVGGFLEYKDGDERGLARAIYTYGIWAVQLGYSFEFAFYKGGIFEPLFCETEFVVYDLLLVGYGEENGKKFWILKNSWGENWGEKGYMRLANTGKNLCGVANAPVLPNYMDL